MMQFQRLNQVCNGGHLNRLYLSGNKSEFLQQLSSVSGDETKCIAILVPSQEKQIKKFLLPLESRARGWRAGKLCSWSRTANLWIFKKR